MKTKRKVIIKRLKNLFFYDKLKIVGGIKMEYTEEQLENVMGGVNPSIADDIAIDNASLYRKEKIEELKSQKEQLLSMDRELTIEELEQITAGVPRI